MEKYGGGISMSVSKLSIFLPPEGDGGDTINDNDDTGDNDVNDLDAASKLSDCCNSMTGMTVSLM